MKNVWIIDPRKSEEKVTGDRLSENVPKFYSGMTKYDLVLKDGTVLQGKRCAFFWVSDYRNIARDVAYFDLIRGYKQATTLFDMYQNFKMGASIIVCERHTNPYREDAYSISMENILEIKERKTETAKLVLNIFNKKEKR